MKFRFLFLGPDDDHADQLESTSDLLHAPSAAASVLYQARGTDLLRLVRCANGDWKPVTIANFQARIIDDKLEDDGTTRPERNLVVRAVVGDQTLTFELPATEFTAMRWVLPHLGPQAIVYPGQQQHVRAAIQSLSERITPQRIFTHLGWRQFDSQWGYLHAGGVLGNIQATQGLQVRLPAALRDYQLSAPLNGSPRQAVRSSLRLLDAAPDRISMPLLAAVYRSVLGAPNFSLFVHGASGVFKSALTAVCQQHFGAAMDASHLPANFASTGNALEWLAHAAKDALLVVDDFAPTGGPGDRELEAVSEQLFRAAGNQQGRHRLAADGLVGEPRPPRALVVATGEQVPRGHSLRARLLIVDVGAGDVRCSILSECQRAGCEGLLASAMAAFLTWVAEQYTDLQAQHQRRVTQLRDEHRAPGRHARTPMALAELQSAWEVFLQFARQVGGISTAEQQILAYRGIRAWAELAARQSAHQQPTDPALRFLGLIKEVLANGQAHVADRRGQAPPDAVRWGWRRRDDGQNCSPQGTCIGWVAGPDLYLDPALSYEVAQKQAGTSRMASTAQRVRQALNQRGLLASREIGRNMLQVRRTLAGHPRKILHLHSSDVLL